MYYNKTELLEIITKQENKYFDLVWYARVKPEHRTDELLADTIKNIQSEHPSEIEALDGEYGEIQNGFHLGVLAALRYIKDIDEHGLEQAKEQFPRLD